MIAARRRAGALVLAAALGLGAGSGLAFERDARVLRVVDGDSLVVRIGDEDAMLRLAEIDAPEHGQPFGEEAKAALRDEVSGATVHLVIVDKDRYGRWVAHVYRSGRHVNRALVREGFAWACSACPHGSAFGPEQAAAARARVGLWSAATPPLPPWQWRAARRHPAPPARDADAAAAPAHCGDKRSCREMSSCAEARYYLRECGLAHLDGDGDGTPCNALCR